ncbi:MAG TPA: insulinase family protein [Candidatus Dojkabacteria bacterium]|nr:insulinase family protein [Candidatus Dojkabacteria bacterium]HQF36119.1 insulinase family protein [Candidatus Dojkabacteria bacterium]
MSPKLIDSWKDSDYSAQLFLYDLGNGKRLLYTHKLGCSECNLSILFKGGALYEKQLKLPLGTAHFLEHMLCRPNGVLKTQEAMDSFCFGTREKPAIFSYAFTSDNMLCFGVDTHVLGYKRAIQFLSYIMSYPSELFSKYIEEERSVILAELGRYPSERKNESLEFNKFILNGRYKRYLKRVLGDKKNIKQIEVSHLQKLWNVIRKNESTVIAVQSGIKPSVKVINEYSELLNGMKEGGLSAKSHFYKLENENKVGYFRDEKAQNVSIEIGILKTRERSEKYTTESYRRSILYVFADRLLAFLLHKTLRDENHLVYEVRSFNSRQTIDWNIYGFSTNFEKGLEKQVLENMWDVIYGRNGNKPKFEKFLNSEVGKQWIEHEVSKSVFVMNVDHDKSYSISIAGCLITDLMPYKYERDYVRDKIVRNIGAKDIIKFIREELITQKPYIWVKHRDPRSEILPEIEKIVKHLLTQ